MKLSIIVPTYNEGNTILRLLATLQAVHYPVGHEIIIVDDASTDQTYAQALSLNADNVRVFRNKTNMGKGFSIREGVREASAEIIVIQDADMEYSPQDIPRLIQPVIENKAAVVYGSRFLKQRYPEGMALPNFMANKFLTGLANLLFGLRLSDMCACYKGFRRDLLLNLGLKANRFEFDTEATTLLAKKGVKIIEVPIAYHGRTTKEGKKIKARDFFAVLLVLLRQRLSKNP